MSLLYIKLMCLFAFYLDMYMSKIDNYYELMKGKDYHIIKMHLFCSRKFDRNNYLKVMCLFCDIVMYHISL